MHAIFRSPIKTGCALAALVAVSLSAAGPADAASARREPNGAIRFYDDEGFDRGYAWCLKRGGRFLSGNSDCSYYTLDLCRAAIFSPPGGDCEPNPWASQVAPAKQPRR
jgi:hypothetical protein